MHLLAKISGLQTRISVKAHLAEHAVCSMGVVLQLYQVDSTDFNMPAKIAALVLLGLPCDAGSALVILGLPW